ncbi:MAG: hypothetical protein Q4F85_11020 [Prevotella sp.]|nr:hypothetical protein [Prevotella sp.]
MAECDFIIRNGHTVPEAILVTVSMLDEKTLHIITAWEWMLIQ